MTTQVEATTLAARDRATQQDPGNLQQLVADAMAASSRSGQQMQTEVKLAERGPGKISKQEYIRYRMYELDKAARKQFISDRLAWRIDDVCGDPEWTAKTVNKWECAKVLAEAGLPTIAVAAVVDRGDGAYRTTPTLRDGSDLGEFLAQAQLPLFAKPNQLLGSFGAFIIEDYAHDIVTISGGEQVSPHMLVDELIGDEPYVLQQLLRNHDTIDAFASGLATIRTVNLVSPASVRTPFTVYKIPSGGNIADNFWRDGNLIAEIDPESGVIQRVVTGTGPYQVLHHDHPETGTPLVGLQLPCWGELRELNRACAEVFGAIRYQTQDIALTNDGPVIVEVNSGGSFDLPQVATGRGLLTKDTRKFFESCGFNFRAIKPGDVGLG